MSEAACSSQKHTSLTHEAREPGEVVLSNIPSASLTNQGQAYGFHTLVVNLLVAPGLLSAGSNYLQLSLMTGAKIKTKSLLEPHLVKQWMCPTKLYYPYGSRK